MFEVTPLEVQTLGLSLKVALWSVAGSLPLALAAAWLLGRHEFPGKTLVDAVIHLPLVLPPVAVGYLLLLLLRRQGPLGGWLFDVFGITVAFTWTGAAVAAAVMAFPLMVRPLRLSVETVDRKLETAARPLGATRLGVFATVTLPLMLPGILAGALLGFARSLGEFGATITFVASIPGETRTLPLALYGLTRTPGGEAAALRLTVLSVVVCLAALIASELLARRMKARLANTLAPISEGRVEAVEPLQEPTARLDREPPTARDEDGAVVAATVAGQDKMFGLTELRFAGGRLRVPHLNLPLGQQLRLRIRAGDVAVALTPPEKTSFLNIIPCVIKAIGEENSPQVELQLDAGGATIQARITARSRAALGLTAGQPVYALVKGIAIDRQGAAQAD